MSTFAIIMIAAFTVGFVWLVLEMRRTAADADRVHELAVEQHFANGQPDEWLAAITRRALERDHAGETSRG